MSIDKLYQCIKSKKVSHSRAREAIYRVLMNSDDECLTASCILDELSTIYPKEVSLNTIYRHLKLFVACELVVMIQDDLKRAYYCLAKEEPLAFVVCRKCNRIEKCTISPNHLIDELESSDFITIHKKCKKCR